MSRIACSICLHRPATSSRNRSTRPLDGGASASVKVAHPARPAKHAPRTATVATLRKTHRFITRLHRRACTIRAPRTCPCVCCSLTRSASICPRPRTLTWPTPPTRCTAGSAPVGGKYSIAATTAHWISTISKRFSPRGRSARIVLPTSAFSSAIPNGELGVTSM